MRVIAGEFRGQRLQAPEGQTTRPITDRVKETIFNIIGHRFGLPGRLPPLNALDLFAGSGSLGIEALSRGARSCLFIERDRRSYRCLTNNLRSINAGNRASARIENAWTTRLPNFDPGYGLVFLDPPYRDANDIPRVTSLLERLTPRLATGAIALFRFQIGTDIPTDAVPGLTCIDDRTIHRMRLLFFSPSNDAQVPTQ